jgi:serine protease AprX
MAVVIPRSLVEYVLLGPADDRRQLQDSPILGDVWIAFAETPDQPQDLLITPFESEPAGRVAQSISRRLKHIPDVRIDRKTSPNVAYLQGIAAARLHFSELMRVVLPLTKWWEEKKRQERETARSRMNAADQQQDTGAGPANTGMPPSGAPQGAQACSLDAEFFKDITLEQFRKMIDEVLMPLPDVNATADTHKKEEREEHQVRQISIDPLYRYVSLTGLILWGAEQGKKPSSEVGSSAGAEEEGRSEANAAKPDGNTPNLAELGSPEKMLEKIGRPEVAGLVHRLFQQIATDAESLKKMELVEDDRSALTPDCAVVWQISRNRRAMPALEKSLPAVKADAATGLFKVDCKEIAWAVLDSGIHGSHPAFNDAEGKTRIKGSYDFRNIRKIVSLDNNDEATLDRTLDYLCPSLSAPGREEERKQKRKDLATLAADADDRRPIHWDLVEQFIRIDCNETPSSGHGTHVAGIIGARKGDDPAKLDAAKLDGMCPNVRLYDFRILTRSPEDTEFAIIAALQYIGHLNSRSSFMRIHGANLSLSIRHDVRNYACGRTPVCIECERLVENGVVVVAAAGNHGWHSYETKEGMYEGYAAFSITDPGNADGVITVGATHRSWPHTYGVSFFSSRGPTGDGRLKPDLVAPGERIRSTLPDCGWGELDGTSMAAPHVSGAAAMLMARYPELVGRPRRVKQVLCDSATDLARERSFQGHGMLDVLRAFQSI